ncbi:hypothetical protein FQA39_LY06662 [Lamprigera yunnana]|nr:hypothetical protein FQA39_LY06662 [Lamprigera yunnana]
MPKNSHLSIPTPSIANMKNTHAENMVENPLHGPYPKNHLVDYSYLFTLRYDIILSPVINDAASTRNSHLNNIEQSNLIESFINLKSDTKTFMFLGLKLFKLPKSKLDKRRIH